MKQRAIKKVQVAIDKFIDLSDDIELDDYLRQDVDRILDRLREFESRLCSATVKKGKITVH